MSGGGGSSDSSGYKSAAPMQAPPSAQLNAPGHPANGGMQTSGMPSFMSPNGQSVNIAQMYGQMPALQQQLFAPGQQGITGFPGAGAGRGMPPMQGGVPNGGPQQMGASLGNPSMPNVSPQMMQQVQQMMQARQGGAAQMPGAMPGGPAQMPPNAMPGMMPPQGGMPNAGAQGMLQNPAAKGMMPPGAPGIGGPGMQPQQMQALAQQFAQLHPDVQAQLLPLLGGGQGGGVGIGGPRGQVTSQY